MKKLLFYMVCLLPSMLFAQAPGCPHADLSVDGENISVKTMCEPAEVILKASVLETGQTTKYKVDAIPFDPPFAVTQGSPIFVGEDDVWSDEIQLPFNFCFYGNMYNSLWIGANGVVTFSKPLDSHCEWSFASPIPNQTDDNLVKNSIYGVFHDVDPSVCGNIRFGVLGTYPCRTFILNYDEICHYSCENLKSTTQMIFYEGTNVIEIYVYKKPVCNDWNGGNALIGIQNITKTKAVCPPGRNTGAWSATNEAWRFTPNGSPNYVITWKKDGAVVGNGHELIQYIDESTFFVVNVTYTNCDGDQYIDEDTISFNVSDVSVVNIPDTTSICSGESTILEAKPYIGYEWSTGETTQSITVSPQQSSTYLITGTIQPECVKVDTFRVIVNQKPIVDVIAAKSSLCIGDSTIITASGGDFYLWNTADTVKSISIKPLQSTTYLVTATNEVGCTNSASVAVTVNSIPVINVTAKPKEGCVPLHVNFSAETDPESSYFAWTLGDGSTSNMKTFTKIYPDANSYDVSLGVTSIHGCKNSVQLSEFIKVYPVPIAGFEPDRTEITTDNPIVNFQDMSFGASSFFWNFGSHSDPENVSTAQNPSHSFLHQGDYTVWQIVSTDDGCSDSASAIIYVTVNMFFYVPNAFTPYPKDGLNDVFKPAGIGIALGENDYDMKIFDRWGRMVFESKNIENGWDGFIGNNPAPEGVYTYRIKVKFGDGLWHVYTDKLMLIH